MYLFKGNCTTKIKKQNPQKEEFSVSKKERFKIISLCFVWTCVMLWWHCGLIHRHTPFPVVPGNLENACGNESQAMPGKSAFHHPSQSSKYHTTHMASSPTKVYTVQSLGKRGDSFTYMVNEETLAFFSHCEDKRQDKNVTCLHVNPCRLLRNGPLCHGPIVLYQPR